MTSELFAIILLISGIVLILMEMLWLYVLSQHQEEYLSKRNEETKTANALLDAVLGAPSPSARESEMRALESTASQSNEMLLCMVTAFTRYDKNREKLSDERKRILDEALLLFNPVPKLISAMKHENKYTQAYICRCLGDLRAKEAAPELRGCLKSKNQTLRYNAGMALSAIGDEEGVLQFLMLCENEKDYSPRIFYELISKYSGNKVSLIRNYFANEPDEDSPYRNPELYDQMRVTLIHAVRNDRLTELKDIYIEGFLGKLPQLRLACVKAMSAIGTLDLKKYLIIATRDKDWLIRLAAIPGLEKIGDTDSLETLAKITTDEQWWIRRRAAEALVRADVKMLYVEKIIQEYDRFAADAVKEVLYKM